MFKGDCELISRRRLVQIATLSVAAGGLPHHDALAVPQSPSPLDPRPADARRTPGEQLANQQPPRWFWEPQDRAMIDWLNCPEASHVLDAGFGKGNHLQLFVERLPLGHVTGVDLNSDSVRAAEQRFSAPEWQGRVSLRQANVLQLPFDDGTFDLVWSSHVMHVLADPIAGVRELRRVCRPAGRIVIREDDLSSMHLLPFDLGIGKPGLELRSQHAFAEWFLTDRIQRGRVPFGWQEVLARAAVQDIRIQSFLYQLSPPFSELQVEYLENYLRGWLELDISVDDKETIRKITERESPKYVLRRNDLHLTDVATIYVGRP